MTSPITPKMGWRTPMVVLAAGSLCVLMAFGLRASLGLFLKPMSIDLGWGREIFAFAIAMQNLLWGALQPFAAACSEKYGTARVIAFGGILYASGLFIMSGTADPLTFQLSAGLLIGAAQSGSALAVVLGAVGRAMPDDKRTMGLGVVTAAGAAGQFTVLPLGQIFLSEYGWSTAYVLLALTALVIIACAPVLMGKADKPAAAGEQGSAENLGEAVQEACRHSGFWLLTAGFFVCGFHVSFIGVHLPAYLSDAGMPDGTGAWSLALIGLFNVFGCYLAGVLGDRQRKKYLLSWLYILRAIVFLLFIIIPVSTASVLAFSIAIGVLWLSTVPLTSGLVAQIFGPRYMGTLFAIVFFNHQVGSFLGIWLGGYFYDTTGSYDPVWWAGVVVGLLAAALHWPIKDQAVSRLAKA